MVEVQFYSLHVDILFSQHYLLRLPPLYILFSGLQIHQIGRTKYVQFFEYQLYLIKAVKKKKKSDF